jgi:N-acyl-D-amino-acid deacylase
MRAPVARRFRTSSLGIVAISAISAAIFVAIVFLDRRHAVADDYAIINATIYDGTGGPSFRGGILIRQSRIVDVWKGRRWRISAKRVIDADGHAVSPGFIDTHTHADFSIGESSAPIHAPNFVLQGVTTLIAGNCGRSPKSYGGFRDLVESRGSNVNIAVLAGLNTIRQAVMGESAATPTRQQMATMSELLERQMHEGAIGVSTGLEYVPGRFASREETLRLLRIAASHHTVHATHMRNEGRFVIDSAREVTSLSAEAGIPLLISHLKVAGKTNCVCFEALLKLLRDYRLRHPLFVDQYPYAASSTNLEIYFPDWFLRQDGRERHHLLRSSRDALKADIIARLQQDGFGDLRFARVVRFPSHPEWSGLTIRTIDQIARQDTALDSQLDVFLDLADRGGAQMVYHNICPELVERIQTTLSPMIGSDSAIRGRAPEGAPHPRGWGTFPKFLGYSVRERKVASLSEAIRRMTDVPARFFGLTGRGRIAPRYYADLVMFDSDKIAARASYRFPFREPIGIEYVFVNGVPVVSQTFLGMTDVTSASPGMFIARNDSLHRRRDGLVASTLADLAPPLPRAPAPPGSPFRRFLESIRRIVEVFK